MRLPARKFEPARPEVLLPSPRLAFAGPCAAQRLQRLFETRAQDREVGIGGLAALRLGSRFAGSTASATRLRTKFELASRVFKPARRPSRAPSTRRGARSATQRLVSLSSGAWPSNASNGPSNHSTNAQREHAGRTIIGYRSSQSAQPLHDAAPGERMTMATRRFFARVRPGCRSMRSARCRRVLRHSGAQAMSSRAAMNRAHGVGARLRQRHVRRKPRRDDALVVRVPDHDDVAGLVLQRLVRCAASAARNARSRSALPEANSCVPFGRVVDRDGGPVRRTRRPRRALARSPARGSRRAPPRAWARHSSSTPAPAPARRESRACEANTGSEKSLMRRLSTRLVVTSTNAGERRARPTAARTAAGACARAARAASAARAPVRAGARCARIICSSRSRITSSCVLPPSISR